MLLRFLCCLLLFSCFVPVMAQSPPPIVIETEHVSLVLAVGTNHRLYQTYLGARLAPADLQTLPARHEAYVPAGTITSSSPPCA